MDIILAYAAIKISDLTQPKIVLSLQAKKINKTTKKILYEYF